jgi:uncharacterized membrane protein YdjX (TVP38/TMEM64 family)
MKQLLKIVLTLAAIFASTFLVARLTGFLNVEEITSWLEQAQKSDWRFLFILVILILFSDLFIAVPTLTVTILSGYFLGFAYGGLASVIGMIMAGLTGYVLSRSFGEKILIRIIKSEDKRKEAINSFEKYGFAMILLSRVSPILPEVSACMAGMSGMRFPVFFLLWCLNTIPYALIASYSGSISSLSNPTPAIYTAIGIYSVLALGWLIFKKVKNQ